MSSPEGPPSKLLRRGRIISLNFIFRWILLVITIAVLGWCFFALRTDEQTSTGQQGEPGDYSTKLVLFWTKFFSGQDPRSSLGPKLFEGCPVNECSAISDQGKLDQSAALIFHAFDVDPAKLPGPRKTGQHYVFFIGESPAHSGGIPETPADFYDMTYTYMLESDVLGQYTYSVPLEKAPKNFAAGKTKLAAWFVSNCQTKSRRENYVKELQKTIPVDIYGGCGPLKCPRSQAGACNDMLRNDYKFYLAFENSICQDYVTEKFTTALENGAVPVVLGAGNMTIFPAKSYIHVDDFQSATELADYLQYLNGNDTAYNEYMMWRFDPELVQSHGPFSHANSGWCQLCQRLHDPTYRTTSYHNIKEWYSEARHCRSGTW